MPGGKKTEPKRNGTKLGDEGVPETVDAGAMDVSCSITLEGWTGVLAHFGCCNEIQQAG